jgi:hypothetical protein
MSEYEELVMSSRAWVNRQDRTKSDLETVIKHFARWCEIPAERVRYLRWDETMKVFTAASDDTFSFSQACHFDRETGDWGVGVSISLRDSAMGAYAKVAFTVRLKAVNEVNSTLTFGDLKPQTLNLQASGWGDVLFPAAIESLKKSFGTPNAKSQIGFNISLSADPEITT